MLQFNETTSCKKVIATTIHLNKHLIIQQICLCISVDNGVIFGNYNNYFWKSNKSFLYAFLLLFGLYEEVRSRIGWIWKYWWLLCETPHAEAYCSQLKFHHLKYKNNIIILHLNYKNNIIILHHQQENNIATYFTLIKNI